MTGTVTGYVTREESNLIEVARSAVGVIASPEVTRLVISESSAPSKLGPTARAALQDTLSRGLVLALAKSGGWENTAVFGRLWSAERLPTLELTSNVVHLLAWVLKTPLTEADVKPLHLERPFTMTEEVFAVLLLQTLKGSGCELNVARQRAFRDSPLVQLAHAGTLGLAHSLSTATPFDAAPYGVFIAALRGLMAASWLTDEGSKRDLARPELLRRVGDAQATVLASFFSSVEGHLPSRALAGFLLDAAARWFSKPRGAADYTESLNTTAPLRERVEARKAGAAMMRAIGQLRTWDQEHRSMHFLDDGFEVGQAMVREWARLGDAGFRHAERVVAELEALPT